MDFAFNLKQLRAFQNLKQEELAVILKCSRYRVMDLERGKIKPTIEDLNLLCDYFHVSSDYLIGRSEVQSSDLSLSEFCGFAGISGKSLCNLHKYLEGTDTIPMEDLYPETWGEDSRIAQSFAEKDSKISFKQLFNYLLSNWYFYEAIKEFASARENICQAINADNPNDQDKLYMEYELSLFRARKNIDDLRHRLFESLETDFQFFRNVLEEN